MKIDSIVRDVVLPIACAITTLACAGLTALLFSKGEVGGGISTLVLTAMTALFVVHDVKRLFLSK